MGAAPLSDGSGRLSDGSGDRSDVGNRGKRTCGMEARRGQVRWWEKEDGVGRRFVRLWHREERG